MTRRELFGVLAAAAAGAGAAELERALWRPGAKLISIPAPTIRLVRLYNISRDQFMDVFEIAHKPDARITAVYLNPGVERLMESYDIHEAIARKEARMVLLPNGAVRVDFLQGFDTLARAYRKR